MPARPGTRRRPKDAAAGIAEADGRGGLRLGLLFANPATHEAYAARQSERQGSFFTAVGLWHAWLAVTLAPTICLGGNLPLRDAAKCGGVHAAIIVLAYALRSVKDKRAVQAYKHLAFAILLTPIGTAIVLAENHLHGHSPALLFAVHFGFCSRLFTFRYTAFLALAGLVAVAIVAVEVWHHEGWHYDEDASRIAFEAFLMASFLFILYSWEAERRELFLAERSLTKQLIDKSQRESHAIMHDLKALLDLEASLGFPTDPASSCPSFSSHRERDPRVLLVEDDPVQLKLLGRRVQKAMPSATIQTATNGREGLERLHASVYDALITDSMMPEMDGASMIQEARAQERLPRVAKVLTAYSTERMPETLSLFLSTSGLELEDIYDKGEVPSRIVEDVARELVPSPRSEGSTANDDVRIEIASRDGASPRVPIHAVSHPISLARFTLPVSDGRSGKLPKFDPSSSSKRLLARVASTASAADLQDVTEMLRDPSVLRGLVEHRCALVDAIERGDAEEKDRIVHKLRGWAASLHAQDLERACTAFQDEPDEDPEEDPAEGILLCLDDMIGPGADAHDGAALEGRSSFSFVSSMALESARRVAVRSVQRLTDVMRGTVPHELLQDVIARGGPGGSVPPLHHDAVAVIFVDKVGSTRQSAKQSAGAFVEHMQRYFEALDRLAADCKVEKIRTIGDGYLATVGVMEDYRKGNAKKRDTRTRVLDAVNFAKRCVCMFREQVRVGVHVGMCESCTVGMTSMQFDLFGSVVNFSARLQDACAPGCVHASAEAMSWLEEEEHVGWQAEHFALEYKGFDGAVQSTLLRPSSEALAAGRKAMDL